MAELLRLVLTNKSDRASANDLYYKNFDKEFSEYLDLSNPHNNKIEWLRGMLSEIIDNFYPRPPRDDQPQKYYDKDFTRMRLEVKVSERRNIIEVSLKHDGNEFDPFADDSPCKQIKLAQAILNISGEDKLHLSSSGGATQGFNFKIDLK
jgi:hypothetical protein